MDISTFVSFRALSSEEFPARLQHFALCRSPLRLLLLNIVQVTKLSLARCALHVPARLIIALTTFHELWAQFSERIVVNRLVKRLCLLEWSNFHLERLAHENLRKTHDLLKLTCAYRLMIGFQCLLRIDRVRIVNGSDSFETKLVISVLTFCQTLAGCQSQVPAGKRPA